MGKQITDTERLDLTLDLVVDISPLTNVNYMFPRLFKDTTTSRDEFRGGVAEALTKAGFESVADRFTEAAEGIQSICPLVVLASGFLFIERFSKTKTTSKVESVGKKTGHTVIYVTGSNYLDKNGIKVGPYRMGGRFYKDTLSAIEASRKVAPDHAPIFYFSELQRRRKSYYMVTVEGTRVFEDFQQAVIYARQVKDMLTKEEREKMLKKVP